MTKLVSVDALRARLGLDAIPVVLDSLDPALEGATTWLLGQLRSRSFDAGSRVETFIPLNSLYRDGLYYTRLRLRDGLLSASPTIVGAPADANLHIDLERGLITIISAITLSGVLVTVTYSAGMSVSSGVYTGVPGWLSDLASLKATVIVDTVNPTLRHESSPSREIAEVERVIGVTVAGRMRYFPNSEQPL